MNGMPFNPGTEVSIMKFMAFFCENLMTLKLTTIIAEQFPCLPAQLLGQDLRTGNRSVSSWRHLLGEDHVLASRSDMEWQWQALGRGPRVPLRTLIWRNWGVKQQPHVLTRSPRNLAAKYLLNSHVGEIHWIISVASWDHSSCKGKPRTFFNYQGF